MIWTPQAAAAMRRRRQPRSSSSSLIASAAWSTAGATLANLDNAPTGAKALTIARATTRYTCINGVLTSVGNNVIRVGSCGVPIEPSAQNVCLQGQDFTTTWAKSWGPDVVTANAAEAPDGTTTAESWAAGATNAYHDLYQSITLTSAAYVSSVFAKAGSTDWVWFYIAGGNVPNAYFDIKNGVVGTVAGTPHETGIIDCGDGWYRPWISYSGTAAAHIHYLRVAEADGDFLVLGDGSTPNMHLWGAQCELGRYPTSYIPTTTAPITRNADNLTLHTGVAAALDTAGQGTITCTVRIPDYGMQSDATIFSVSDGTSSEVIELKVAAPGDQAEADMRSAAGAAGDANVVVDIADGDEHDLSLAWQGNRLSLKVDGTEAADTNCAVPSGLDALRIGRNVSDAAYLNGWVKNLNIYDKALH